MIFGYENGTGDGIRDGEIVSVMFLNKSFPSRYLKNIAAQEKVEAENADTLGIDPEPVAKKHKEGGLVWNYAIIARKNGASDNFISTLVKDDDGKLTLPSYNIFGSYNQFIPEFIRDNNLGFQNIIRGGIHRKYRETDNVVIVQHFPNTLPEKDWESGMTADQINDDNLAVFKHLWDREVKRVANWNTIIRKWDRETEADAYNKLNQMIASRLLLYNCRNLDAVEYYLPQTGMIFSAKVSRKGKYIDLIAFEWDKEYGAYLNFSNGTEAVLPAYREEAKRLVTLRDDYWNQLSKQKEEVVEVEASSDSPF